MIKKLKKQKGMISVFFACFLSLILVMTIILADYYRIRVLASRMRSSLRLGSKLALSNFDKNIAREYGLFVIRDIEETSSMIKQSWEEGFDDKDLKSDSFPIKSGEVELRGQENSQLSKPNNLSDQIVQFVEWQRANILLDKLKISSNLFKDLDKFNSSLEKKFDYEKELNSFNKLLGKVGDKNSTLPDIPDAWKEISGDQEFFKGISDMGSQVNDLASSFTEIDKIYSKAKDRAKDEEGGGLYVDDYNGLKEDFNKVKDGFLKQKKSIEALKEYIGKFKTSIDSISGKAENVAKLSEDWYAGISDFPAGPVKDSCISDYFSKDPKADLEGLNKLGGELHDIEKSCEDMSRAWNDISLNGRNLEKLTFDEWLADKESKSGSNLSVSNKLTEAGSKFLSDEALEVEKNVILAAPSKRSGLIEFIKAWNRKRKLKARAKIAEKKGLANLAQSISQIIGPGSYSRYGNGEGGFFSRVSSAFSMGSDEAILSSLVNSGKCLSSNLLGNSFFNEVGKDADIFLYLSNMFSNRISEKRVEKGETKGLSLTGNPLKDRPFYGGELEYVVFGKDYLMDNIRSAEHGIFALRLAANLAYAFSSAELYQETSVLALALAGWTGFGVPMVQTVLLSILALGESKLDLDDLVEGNKVPLFKNPGSWRFSLNGIKDLAGEIMTDAFDYLEIQAQSGVEAFSEILKDQTKKMTGGAKDLVKNSIKKSVSSWMMGELTGLRAYDPKKSGANFDHMMDSLVAESDTTATGQAIKGGLSAIKSGKSGVLDLLNKAMEAKKKSGRLTSDVADMVNNGLDVILDPLAKKACKSIDKLEEAAMKRAHILRKRDQEEVTKNLGGFLSKYEKDLGGGSSANISLSAGLSMDYRDYMNFFLAMGLMGARKDAILINTAKLVHAETGTTDLSTAPTKIEIDAQASIRLNMLGSVNILTSRTDRFSKDYIHEEKWKEGYGEKVQ